MVMIGNGRDDPRQWVQAAYLLLDAVQSGATGPQGKLPTQAEVATKLGIVPGTVTRAYRELAEMGIVYWVPGCGYFTSAGGRR